MKPFGIVYLSFGKNYADCTIAALKSKVRHAPKTPALVITNRKDDMASKFCKRNKIRLKYVNAPTNMVRAYKTQLYKYTPWEYTLLLDADGWVNKELSAQFRMLDHVPIALTHAHHHPSIGTVAHAGASDRQYTIKALGGMRWAPQYASGLIFFRRDDKQVRKLFDAWYAEWKVFGGKDQTALIRAIFKTGVLPLVLAQKHWLTGVEGKGFVSHSFGPKLPSMPRKDRRSPLNYRCIP